MDTGVAVGGAVEVWRCDVVRPVGLMALFCADLVELHYKQRARENDNAHIRTGCIIATLCFLRSCRIFANSEAFILPCLFDLTYAV